MAARTHREVRDKACRELRSRECARVEIILWRGERKLTAIKMIGL